MGRFTLASKGLHIIPTPIEPTFTGELKVLARIFEGALAITPCFPLAQLILLPVFPKLSNPCYQSSRKTNETGVAEVFWAHKISPHTRPTLTLKLNGKAFTGFLDSGADATVISSKFWPKAWPLKNSVTHLQGIGQANSPLVSSQALTWTDPEGNTGIVTPYVVSELPVNLWGRDILSQMNVIMCSPNEAITKQMLRQGFLPGQGLGKQSQGIKQPIQVTQKSDKTGLGFSASPNAKVQNFP